MTFAIISGQFLEKVAILVTYYISQILDTLLSFFLHSIAEECLPYQTVTKASIPLPHLCDISLNIFKFPCGVLTDIGFPLSLLKNNVINNFFTLKNSACFVSIAWKQS